MTKRVAIVAMGESRKDFVTNYLVARSEDPISDAEIWAINYMGGVIQCDRIIAMDPFTEQETVDAYPPHILAKIKNSGVPIYSSAKAEGFNVVEYPLDAIKERLGGFAYFNNTVAYAIALAIHEGVEQLMLFGCDFTYPNIETAESGRGCAEFWIGVALARGMQIVIGGSSTLLDQHSGRQLYGYPKVEVTECPQTESAT